MIVLELLIFKVKYFCFYLYCLQYYTTLYISYRTDYVFKFIQNNIKFLLVSSNPIETNNNNNNNTSEHIYIDIHARANIDLDDAV